MVMPWKTIKVFVSSTFKDLERERDRLQSAFEGVKERIADRHLALVPYDLRWRDRRPGEPVVAWCLEAVASCPYFVNILDGRYGWRPGVTGRSITEMEIDEAIGRGARRLFFFREGSRRPPPQAVGETAADREDLERLESRLERAGELVFTWQETSDLVASMGRELQHAIDGDYPAGRVVEVGEVTLAEATRELIEEKARGFVGRTAHLAALGEFVRRRGLPHTLAIQAVAGTGKSALLARFLEEFRDPGVAIVAHFLGVGGRGREPAGITEALASGLREAGVLAEPPDLDPEVRRLQIARALETTERPVILAIDGLDEVEEGGADLLWLPVAYGPGVRVLVTSRPVEIHERLARRPNVSVYELPPLADRELELILADFARQNGLALSAENARELVRRAAGNPLFLEVALDEIVASGLAIGQLATTVDGLFRQILSRLEAEHGQERLADYLGLIAASRDGLAEEELAEALPREAPVPTGEIAAITRALAHFVVARRGLLDFFHAEFERSVKERLGVGPMRSFHRRLARFFFTKGGRRERRLVEMAYQCTKAEWWANLANLLTHLPYLEAKARAGLVFDLAGDYEFALRRAPVTVPRDLLLEKPPGVAVDRRILELLAEALGRDLAFLARRPASLFQEIHHHGHWFDSPEASHHYLEPEGGWREPPPWLAFGPKLHALVDSWGLARAENSEPWLRLLRPLPDHLASPLAKVLRGHEGDVVSAAFSPDGARVVSSAWDGTARIWDAATGAEIRLLRGQDRYVESAAFSPDGSRVVSGGGDWMVRIWDAATGAELRVLRGHEGAVRGVSFDPVGSRVASASNDRTVRTWDAATGAEVRILRGHEREVRSAAFSPDGSRVVSASEDGTVRIWDAARGAELRILRGHEEEVVSAAFSPDGSRVVSASSDVTVRIWDAADGAELRVLRGHGDLVQGASFSPDGSRVVSASSDCTLRIWDTAAGAELRVLSGHEGAVQCAAFSPDGSRLVSGSSDSSLRIWDAAAGDLRILRGGDVLASSAAFSPDGSRLVAAAKDRTVRIWDAATGGELRVLSGHEGRVLGAAFSPDGSRVVSASSDRTIRIWDAATGAELRVLRGHEEPVDSAVFNPDGSRIVSTSLDRTALWDATTGAELRVLSGFEERVHGSAFSADGSRLALAAKDRTVRILDGATGAELRVLRSQAQGVGRASASPDGSRVVSAYLDHTVRIWDAATGAELAVLLGHRTWPTIAIFSPDGSRVVTASLDRTVRVWDASSGAALEVIRHDQAHALLAPEALLVTAGIAPAPGAAPPRFRLRVEGPEAVLERVPTGEPVAYLPGGEWHAIATSPTGSGLVWALGTEGGYVGLYALDSHR